MATRKKPAKRPPAPRNPVARALRAMGLFGPKVVKDKRKATVKKAPKWRQDDSAD